MSPSRAASEPCDRPARDAIIASDVCSAGRSGGAVATRLSLAGFGAHCLRVEESQFAESNGVPCQVGAFILVLLEISSVHSTMWISVCRFAEIRLPFSHTWVLKGRGAVVITGTIWAYSVLMASLPFLGLGTYAYIQGKALCAPRFQDQHAVYYGGLALGFSVGIPILVLCAMYATIVRAARKQAKRGTFVCNEDNCRYVPANRYLKCAMVLVSTMVILLSCWLPYLTISFYTAITHDLPYTAIEAICTWLLLSSSALNPWMNSLSQKTFRDALSSLTPSCCPLPCPPKKMRAECAVHKQSEGLQVSSNPFPNVT
uniref:G-protein coupled receptors family 1 profile domain-containing protein n=1 Tax=Eptatretus burgeri TaxID=7764 RepID=A0A8C4NF71_EPTBU